MPLIGLFLVAFFRPYLALPNRRARAWFALKCFFGVIFLHEFLWITFATWFYPVAGCTNPSIADWLNPWSVCSQVTRNIFVPMTLVYLLRRGHKIDWTVVKFGLPPLLGYFVVWAFMGYHVTIIANGLVPVFSVDYHDLTTNLTEIGSWDVAGISFSAAILLGRARGKLLASLKNVS